MSQNEANQRRAILNAVGITGTASNERDFAQKLAVGLASINPKTKSQIVSLVALTNNSGGTADNTVENIPAATAATTDTSAASLTSTNASITAIKNDVADLTAKLNALIAALKA